VGAQGRELVGVEVAGHTGPGEERRSAVLVKKE
jgi:hypothetical protein